MELLLNDQQRQLQDSAARLCRDAGGCYRARALRDESIAIDGPALKKMVSAGWLGLLAGESAGGVGLGAFELALLSREVGRQLLHVPLAPLAAAIGALAEAGADVEDAIAGKRLVVPALRGAAAPFDISGALPRAAGAGDDLRLQGAHHATSGLGSAHAILASAVDDTGAAVLCLVEAGVPGVVRHMTRLLDGSEIGDLVLDAAPAQALARGSEATRLIATLQAHLVLAASAEMLGLGEAALELALAYLKLRHQFGRPIGSFQALQHRAVDGFVELEMLTALIFRVSADRDAGWAHPAMMAATKAKAGASVLAAVRFALQVHGAIGYTDEHDLGLFYKRAIALDAHLGNEAAQLQNFSSLSGAGPSDHHR